jgi:probable rRNA maturation factor
MQNVSRSERQRRSRAADTKQNGHTIGAPRISVRNRQRTVSVNVGDLEKFAPNALRACLRLRKRKPTDLTKLSEIFVWLISDRRMAALHQQFLHQTGPTDVLTFQHGEIFISVETARRHARAFGNSLARELCLYIVHGLLHLHGFEDRKPTDVCKMEKMQKRILREAL